MKSRRRIIQTCGIASTGLLAGCVDLRGDDTQENDMDDEPSIEITDVEFDSLEGSCTSESESSVEAEQSNGTVTVNGYVIRGNPCYEASLASSQINGDELVLSVSVSETRSDAEVCQECIGKMPFDAVVSISGDTSSLNTVTIRTVDKTFSTTV